MAQLFSSVNAGLTSLPCDSSLGCRQATRIHTTSSSKRATSGGEARSYLQLFHTPKRRDEVDKRGENGVQWRRRCNHYDGFQRAGICPSGRGIAGGVGSPGPFLSPSAKGSGSLICL